jgi:hypothetical protein
MPHQIRSLYVRANMIKPSPPEKKTFWPRRSNPSGTSTSTRNSESEIEPFSISRESFDSYRRSFVGVSGSALAEELPLTLYRTSQRNRPSFPKNPLDGKAWTPPDYKGSLDQPLGSDDSRDSHQQQKKGLKILG